MDGDQARSRWGDAAVRASLASGVLARVARDIYAPALYAPSLEVRCGAAIRICERGGRGAVAVTGLAALFLAGAIDRAPDTVLVAIDRHHHVTRVPELTRYYRCVRHPETWMFGDLPVAEPEWALVHAMRELGREARKDLALFVIGRRALDPWKLVDIVNANPWAKGRAELRQALELHKSGIDSPLEYRGLTHILHGEPFAGLKWQHQVRIRDTLVRFDAYDPQTMVAIEFDGQRFHSSPGKVAADKARDLLVASAGILTVRVTHAMIENDAEGCRRLILATMRGRQARRAA